MEISLIGIVCLFLGGFLPFLTKSQNLKLKISSIMCSIASLLALINVAIVYSGKAACSTFYLGAIFQNVTFSMDYLSAFFIFVISIMSLLGVIYANGYLKSYIEKGKDVSSHLLFLMILVASMLLVCVVQNVLMFLVVWELMSLSSFFLVIFENEKKDVLKAGIKYLVYMHISVVFIMVAFAILAIKASSLDFNTFRTVLSNNTALANLIFILAFIGFGTKAGFSPFHNWLPDAHPAAPSHVSGIMSGVMIKTGIYGILRVLSFIPNPDFKIGYFVLIISVISALYGVLYAITQHDIKRLLAYHSIENIGIIGIGIGTGMLGLAYNNQLVALLGFAGGILHILNHSIFKELLFFAAGSVYAKTHTRNIEVLGGLIKKMPATAVLFLIASIAICGIPPFNGFISEFMIYFGMLNGLMINNLLAFIVLLFSIAGLALIGTMAILCFTKAFSIIFLGEARSENAQKVESDTSFEFIFPMVILAIFIVLIGLFPRQAFNFVQAPLSIYVKEFVPRTIAVSNILNLISYVSIAIILLVVLLYVVKLCFKNNYDEYVTWGCGYNRGNAKIQYTASSYASPFISMLRPLFKKVTDIKKPKSVFPKEAHYEMHMEDAEEAYFVQPLLKFIENFLQKFEKIQNGNIQQYITYGLIFLAFALVCIVLLG